jgi:hypothetical protein
MCWGRPRDPDRAGGAAGGGQDRWQSGGQPLHEEDEAAGADGIVPGGPE